MGDKDESEWETIGYQKSGWAWEFTSIIVPLIEVHLKSFPPLNKCTLIGNNVLPLVAINIHPVSGFLVPPVKFLEPVGRHLL